MACEIRAYARADLAVLRSIYAHSIRDLGESAYTEEQVAAWSSFSEDAEPFKEWIEDVSTFVAVSNDGACIGFGGLEASGRISSLFVTPAHMRTGVGSMLLQRLMAEAKSVGVVGVTTQASEFSKPLFEKFGFFVVEMEHTEFKGIAFDRYVMRATFE